MNVSSNLRHLTLTCSVTLAWLMANRCVAGQADSQKEYHFPLGGYELTFSVPREFLSDYWGNPDEPKPELIVGRRPGQGTGAVLFSQTHMFAGPIWIGHYAAMDFSVSVVEPAVAYQSPVSSLKELEEYQRWQLATQNSYERYDFSRKAVAGETWLLMTLIRTDTPRAGKRDDENVALCFPLGDRRYLLIVCRLMEYVPNKSRRWLADAHKMRDQILTSVAVRKSQLETR